MNEYIKDMVERYMSKASWRVTENANARWSFSGLQSHLSGAIMSDYALNELYTLPIKDAHKNHSIHIHDLDGGGKIFYCLGHSLQQLLETGFGGVSGKVSASPAKHLTAILGQMVNFLGTLQNESSGAQAFSSFDTYLAPFVRYDKLTYEQVKQTLQEFIFSINQSSRWGNQVPFTNITMDWIPAKDLKDKKAIIGGKQIEETYGDFQKEMDMINKAFIEIMVKGDADGRIFTFPIPTYNITKDFDWDSENAKLLFKMTGKYGTPYFQNFLNSHLKPEDVRSMCCRLQLNLKELRTKTGGLFGSGEQTGSIGVVTINLAQLGYLHSMKKDGEDGFFKELTRLMDISSDSLEIKRKEVDKSLKSGLIPYTSVYLGTTKNHFSTIGLNGMHECCQNFFGDDKKGITGKEGKTFAIKVLDFMRTRLTVYQEKTDNLYNLEATPAEGTSYRFAKWDLKHYKDIKHAGTPAVPYYTNSTHLPVDNNGDIFEAIEHQDELQCKYTGGTVFHGFIGERIHDWRSTRNLVKKIAENSKMPYFTITPTFSICSEHGYISGEHEICPLDKCDGDMEIYSRVVGYYRPIKQWNKGKKREFKDRKTFTIEKQEKGETT